MSPRTRCGVQCVSHPALRCGVHWRESPRTTMLGPVCESPRTTMRGPERKGEAFICRYSWIPHQVRNDREGISGFRVAPGHPAQRCGVHWRESPRTTMRGPVCESPRTTMRGPVCESPRTAMRGPERKGEAFICRYSWIPHQVRNDGKYRVAARYDEVTGSSVCV